MKSVIIGTAGHIDHGKTAVVKALTGIDADRLEEEKRRGITIDLGFAHLELEVPGGLERRQGGEADHAPSPGSPTRPLLAGRGESRLQQEQNEFKATRSACGGEGSDKNANKLRRGFIDGARPAGFFLKILRRGGGTELAAEGYAGDALHR